MSVPAAASNGCRIESANDLSIFFQTLVTVRKAGDGTKD